VAAYQLSRPENTRGEYVGDIFEETWLNYQFIRAKYRIRYDKSHAAADCSKFIVICHYQNLQVTTTNSNENCNTEIAAGTIDFVAKPKYWFRWF